MKHNSFINRTGLLASAYLFLAGISPAHAAAVYPSIKPFGYLQYSGSGGKGTTANQFAFKKVRVGIKGGIDTHIGYRIMVDLLNLNGPVKGDTTAEGLDDAILSYRLMPALKLSAGQFKTPFGMEYGGSVSKLDVIGFGMVTNVTLDRGMGVMASGRNVAGSGVGYGIGVFNAGTRADGTTYTAYTTGTKTRGKMYIGKMLFDGLDGAVHLEGGGARSVVNGSTDYKAAYAGLRFRYRPLELKAEWLRGRQGVRATTVVYGQLLATVTPKIELVGKWERTRYRNAGTNLTADNWIFGLNAALYPENPKRARLQVNYIVARKDARSLGTHVGFKKGYKDNQFVVLLQAGF